jgi:hypothetical protein
VAKNLGLDINETDVDHDARLQPDAMKRLTVLAVRNLVIGGAAQTINRRRLVTTDLL